MSNAVKPGGRVELVPRSTNKKWKPFTLLHGVPVSEEDVTVEMGIIYFSPLTIAGESDTLFSSTRELRK
jgi:hypothetical protein